MNILRPSDFTTRYIPKKCVYVLTIKTYKRVIITKLVTINTNQRLLKYASRVKYINILRNMNTIDTSVTKINKLFYTNNINKSHKYIFECEKPDTNDYIVYGFIYIKFKIGKVNPHC